MYLGFHKVWPVKLPLQLQMPNALRLDEGAGQDLLRMRMIPSAFSSPIHELVLECVMKEHEETQLRHV